MLFKVNTAGILPKTERNKERVMFSCRDSMFPLAVKWAKIQHYKLSYQQQAEREGVSERDFIARTSDTRREMNRRLFLFSFSPSEKSGGAVKERSSGETGRCEAADTDATSRRPNVYPAHHTDTAVPACCQPHHYTGTHILPTLC